MFGIPLSATAPSPAAVPCKNPLLLSLPSLSNDSPMLVSLTYAERAATRLLVQRRGIGQAAQCRAEVGGARFAVACFEFRAHLALHLFPVAAKGAIRKLFQGGDRAEVEVREIFRLEREGPRGHAVDQKRAHGVAVGEVLKVLLAEDGLELFREEFRVGRTHAEGCFGADVAHDRVPYFLVELCDELVGDDEREFVFSRFGEDGTDGGRREVLEFVDVEVEDGEVPATRVDARERRLQELRSEERRVGKE